jgi:hypothetical protein
VLAEQGRIDEACDLLQRVLATAPGYFVEALREELSQSRHVELRKLSQTDAV